MIGLVRTGTFQADDVMVPGAELLPAGAPPHAPATADDGSRDQEDRCPPQPRTGGTR
jgi:hypothetical protein